MACSCKTFLKYFLMWRIPDYLIIIILAIIAAIVGAKVRPHCRPFEWDDPTINYPAEGNIFPMYSVAIAVIFVAFVYVGGELATRWHRPAGKVNMLLHLNGWIVTHAYSILLAFALVNLSKLYAGRLRPRFLAMLAEEGITRETAGNYTAQQICHAAREGRLSFPSGHSGTAFSGYVPPVLYLFGLCRSLNGGHFWIKTLCMVPLILPMAIAISRTVDYHHNFDDILCGSLIGAACGIIAVFAAFRPSPLGEWTLRDHPDHKAVDNRAVAPQSYSTERRDEDDENHLMEPMRLTSDNPIEPQYPKSSNDNASRPTDRGSHNNRGGQHSRVPEKPQREEEDCDVVVRLDGKAPVMGSV